MKPSPVFGGHRSAGIDLTHGLPSVQNGRGPAWISRCEMLDPRQPRVDIAMAFRLWPCGDWRQDLGCTNQPADGIYLHDLHPVHTRAGIRKASRSPTLTGRYCATKRPGRRRSDRTGKRAPPMRWRMMRSSLVVHDPERVNVRVSREQCARGNLRGLARRPFQPQDASRVRVRSRGLRRECGPSTYTWLVTDASRHRNGALPLGSDSVVEFDSSYEGTPPWDIGRPQPAFVAVAQSGVLVGHVLDIGCGTGEHALMAAGLGLNATGIDFSPNAIRLAKQKAREETLRRSSS